MKLKLGTKIMGGFVFILLLMSIVGYFGISGMNDSDTTYGDVITNNIPVKSYVWDLRSTTMEQVSAIRGFMLYKDEKYTKLFEDLNAEYDKVDAKIEPLLTTDKSKQLMEKLNSSHDDYEKICQEIIVLVRANNMKEAFAKAEVAKKSLDAFKKQSVEFTAWVDQVVGGKVQGAMDSADSNTNLALIVIVVAIILGLALGVYLTRSISKPVAALTNVANTIAEGDLTKAVPKVNTGDEVEVLAEAFCTMLQNLRNLIIQVNDSSTHVASTAQQMSAASDQNSEVSQQIARAMEELAKGNTEQTGLITSTVENMEQMAQSIESIASGAQEQARNVTVT
ncbi:MAG TPA: methyl-accepting chemotaxis protein, partial [Bacillota bacterium]|nr:methyl-accepting chemotaxis protein [Bacillota bacterium]